MVSCAYVIGDIHGCYNELLLLEQEIHRHAREINVTPFFVSVGDLIDRGPQSLEVVKHFRLGVASGTHFVVAGNHEASLFENLEISAPHLFQKVCSSISDSAYPIYSLSLRERYKKSGASNVMSFTDFGERMLENWLVQGGRETLASFGSSHPDDPTTWCMPLEDVVFLFQLPLLWENEHVVVTHALATPLEIQYARQLQESGQFEPFSEEHLAIVEGLTWRRRVPFEAPHPSKLHISGHTPIGTPAEHTKIRSLQIDTGCVYGNTLTAYCVETKEFLSVNSSVTR